MLLLLLFPKATACGPHYPNQGQYGFFDQRLVGNPLWLGCFNIHKSAFNSRPNDWPKKWRSEHILRGEWQDYAKEIGSALKLDELIFQGDFSVVTGLIAADNEPKEHAALQYIEFTIRAAPFVQNAREDWAWQSQQPDEHQLPKLLVLARARAEDKTLSSYLRLRYGFQAVRLSTVFAENDMAIANHNQYVAPGKTGLIRYMSMGYKARALFLSGKRVEAARIYCQIYDQCPTLSNMARKSLYFMGVTGAEWDALLASVKHPHRQATAWFLRTLMQKRDYSAEPLRRLLELEPRSDRTETLLVRMIHGIEHYNMETDHTRFFEPNSPTTRYAELIELCAKAGAMGDAVRTPALWNAAGAYLALLDGQTTRATQLLTAARSANVKDAYLKNQIDLVDFLLAFQTDRIGLNDALGNKLAPLLSWYSGDPDAQIYNRKIYNSLLMFAMHRYVAVGDGKRTAMSMSAAGFSEFAMEVFEVMANDEDLAALEAFHAAKKSALDTHLAKRAPIGSVPDVIYYRAVNHIRRQRYEAALRQLGRLEANYLAAKKKLSFSTQNPEFEEKITRESMSLADFCQRMIDLQGQVAPLERENPRQAMALHLTMGNMIYTMGGIGFPEVADAVPRRRRWKPVYGFYDHPDAWYEMKGSDSVRKTERVEFDKRIDNYHRAEAHYRKMVELDADPELAAQACVLVQTSRNAYLYYKVEPNRKEHEYFYLLSEKYSETAFYKELLARCAPLKLYQ